MFVNDRGEQVFTGITNGGPVFVYVKDGKILRVEPLELCDEDAASWTIDARGQKFSPDVQPLHQSSLLPRLPDQGYLEKGGRRRHDGSTPLYRMPVLHGGLPLWGAKL